MHYIGMFWHEKVTRLQNYLKPVEKSFPGVCPILLWNISPGFVFSPVQVLSNGRLVSVTVQNFPHKHWMAQLKKSFLLQICITFPVHI